MSSYINWQSMGGVKLEGGRSSGSYKAVCGDLIPLLSKETEDKTLTQTDMINNFNSRQTVKQPNMI